MKLQHINSLFLLIILFATPLGCATTDSAGTDSKSGPVAQLDNPPKTLAILPFENNSVTKPEIYEPLSNGLSAILITDLNRSGTNLKIIERLRIQSLLKEVDLGQSGIVDEATAVRVGKILGAQAIAFGSFMVLGKSVRIDVRIIKVETSELIMAESVTGSSSNFIGLEQQLAGKIAHSLRVALQPEPVSEGSDIEAALYFSKGLESLDNGNLSEAKQYFDKSISLDPLYQKQVESVKGLN